MNLYFGKRGCKRMKYLKQATILFGITMAGEFLNYVLPLPVPAGVYGLFILLGFLCFGVIKVEEVSEAGDFFLDIMPLTFIPAGAGLLNSIGQMRDILVPLLVITAVSTVFVMILTAKVAQGLVRRPRKKEGI